MLELKEAIALRAKFFRGLADASRLSILETLLEGEKSVSQIVAATGLSQPNVSAHLTCLRDCGLVRSRQAGRHVFYTIAEGQIEGLLTTAQAIVARVSEEIYRCPRY